MSNATLFGEDSLDDGSLLDSYATTGSALLEPSDGTKSAEAEWTGPCCEKCEAPLGSDVVSICRRCGWYASLGTFVEVDPDWETAMEPAAVAAQAPQPTSVLDWIRSVPSWAWLIGASLMLVIVESIAARFATPAGSWTRTAWSLSQLAIGVLAVTSGHIINFLVLAADDAEIGLLDLLLKPLRLWARAVHNLPARLWISNSAASGLVAAVMSVVVIGGIPYERLWDWGFKEPPKQDLMGAVMSRVNELDSGKGADSLEGAVGDFAGSQNPDQKDKPKAEPPKPKNNADCVIIGYLTDKDGLPSTLLLGTAHRGDLVFAGNVTPKLPDSELKSLADALKSIETKKPIIKIDSQATWVQPKYTCRVSFGQQTKSGFLREIEWDKMLGRIEKR